MAGKNKIMQAVVSFAGTIDPSLGKAMDNVAGHLDKVNWKAVAVGAAVGGIAVATGKAVVEAGKYLAELRRAAGSRDRHLQAQRHQAPRLVDQQKRPREPPERLQHDRAQGLRE